MSNNIKVFHADHGINPDLIQRLAREIQAEIANGHTKEGLVIREVVLPKGQPDALCALRGPKVGDEPILGGVHWRRRSSDRPQSRVIALPKVPTRIITIIGSFAVEDEATVVYTCYGGPTAPREPGDSSLIPGSQEEKESREFWAVHALSSQM